MMAEGFCTISSMRSVARSVETNGLPRTGGGPFAAGPV